MSEIASTTNATGPNPQKVLIVEDSKAFAASLASLIQHEFDVVLVHDFKSAKLELEQRAKEFFVSITDLNLPDAADGEAVSLVKSYGIPSIVFTGNFSNSLREDIQALGICDYVLKQGVHDLAYVANMVHRIYYNPNVHVLVIDDSKAARNVISEYLTRQRYHVTAVESGAEAIKLLQQYHDYQIVIIDLMLEGIDGFEVLKRLRARHDFSEMAIIGVSGRASQEQVAKFIKYGGNDFIRKPFEPEEFFCRINTASQTLEHFEKLRQLNDQKRMMLGMAAHDIRNPLGNILTGLSMLRKRNKEESTERMLNLVTQSATHMLELLNGLLDISAVEQSTISLNISDIDLREPLLKVKEEMSMWAGDKQQTLVLTVPMEPVIIQGDALRIQEVISNLVSNAIKYSPIGGNIEISLSFNEREALLQVKDQGVGVPVQEQPRLFDPFVKLSPRPTGGEQSTGLGLAICKKNTGYA
ncbi:MAG: hybrid sensor histidine kinase/response regulator [Hahellaceae bacterium]|nr:hybrid sensor histidine kinase/response regulator [Hahellaceae bacterium]MCP5169137.1 hybrid sensor histidine kinase/response regulator [Hahellaceae bacterium]